MKQRTTTEPTRSPVSRRHFLKGTAALGTLALLTPASRVFGANNRFRFAACGVRDRGNYLMRTMLGEDNVEVAWIVDPDRRLLEQRSQEVLEMTGRKPRTTTDVRHALEDPNVDAILVGAPNHWHSIMVIWAAQAGKHCFVEKPASHDVYEGRVALEAARKYGVVVQHGTQRRNRSKYADLVKTVQSGKYGRLAVSHGFSSKSREGIGHAEPSPPPDWLDWDLWRGHAMVDEYRENRLHYNWHWFWNTGNGDITNMGVHQIDVAHWALDPEMHGRHPSRVMSLGGRFVWDDQGETPNTHFGVAEYPNGQKVVINIRNVDYDGYERLVDNRFYFEDGGVILGEYYIYIAPDGTRERLEVEKADVYPGDNLGSFLRACRRGRPDEVNAGMLEGHYSSAIGHLMNISYRVGREEPFSGDVVEFDNRKLAKEFDWFHARMRDDVGLSRDEHTYRVGPWLTFDSDAEQFTGDHADEANPLLRYPRREGYEIPEPDKV